ncbi:Stealth CR1 domain-containing protein [Maribius pontilimi]|uniref:Stealth CR1 domain-containing protein n=1 Tax=Palleronia pontilimi TaxID=1964209 RepID=A0A934I9W6_9RHOB|nr:stealth family protein [Palleronia pontilimi]MBJ3763118.1 Stealth CR1 domain-containing protein [Palleronia pontilimi]
MQIDAVIAWVDGADPAHRAKRAAFGDAGKSGSDQRFVETGEIYVALASILEHAPFVRRIHIVTDDQRPALLPHFAQAGLCAPDRIRVVDHDAIFAGLPAARPNFNSRAIEAALHRIPDLSERFVYLNDDMFFNGPCAPGDLFDPDGRPLLSGRMVAFSDRRPAARLKSLARRLIGRPDTRPSHLVAQETAARLAGFRRTFLRVPHRPHPLRVSTIRRALAAHPGLLERQVGYRFRDRAQYLPVALANHAEIAGGAEPRLRDDVAYLRDRMSGDVEPVLSQIRDGYTPFACVQGLESMPPASRDRVLAVLVDKFGDHLPPAIRTALMDPA